MSHIGLGIISLIVYIISILFLNVKLKRKMGESMMWSSIILIFISVFFGKRNFIDTVTDSFLYASKQEVVYAGLAFVFMAYLMDQTNVIERLVDILNSLLGKLPGGSGYVATIGCALFGMVSGVASASTAAIGSVTIPWMKKTGWSSENAAAIVAGNGGLGNVFPPSSTMLLFLGLDEVSKELGASNLYVGLFSVAGIVLVYRLFVVYILAKKDNIKTMNHNEILPFKEALKKDGSSLMIFLGVIIPLLLTMGSTGNIVKNILGKDAFKSISLILYIPILIIFFTLIEGRKYLPKTFSEWINLFKKSISRFSELGALLVFAFVASRLLVKLNLSQEFTQIFGEMSKYSSMIIILSVSLIITLMVGPFNSTATTTALGAVSYAALRSIGLSPVASAVAFINLVSNQSCVPPNSAPIYIACGIAEVEEPFKIFKTLVIYFAIPQVIFCILIMLNIIPVFGG